MALVDPAARTATASVTSLARSADSATSPVMSGLLLQGPGLVLGLPLIVAGTLKSAYDLLLWAISTKLAPESATERTSRSWCVRGLVPSESAVNASSGSTTRSPCITRHTATANSPWPPRAKERPQRDAGVPHIGRLHIANRPLRLPNGIGGTETALHPLSNRPRDLR